MKTNNPPTEPTYDESDRCPLCHKQPDEASLSCVMCGDRAWNPATGTKFQEFLQSVNGGFMSPLI